MPEPVGRCRGRVRHGGPGVDHAAGEALAAVMRIDFTPQQEDLRPEIRGDHAGLFTPELPAAFDLELELMGGPVFREIVARMGKDGWLGLGWPKEYGGQARSPLDQFIFWDETYKARAALHIIPVLTIAP